MSTLMTGCTSAVQPCVAAPGAPHLRLMALGGPMTDLARAGRGMDYLRAMGFLLDNIECARRRDSRFAGDDEARLADLNALADPGVPMPDMIMATRGGYGTARLLDRVDYDRLCPRLRQHGTILMGYSDNTAMQLALLARGGVVSFSGPMLYGDFDARPPSPFMLQWFRQVLTSPSFTLRISAPSPVLPALEGVLWGGNLSVLCTLIGTPWMPRVSGGILFLEDVGEDVYRVERMLLQLLQTGILASQSAILLGRFSASRPDGYDPQGYTLERMIDAFRARLAVPVLTGLPVGHVPDIVPLPIGARARLTSMATGFALTVSGYPVLARLPAAFQAPASGDLTLMKD